MNDLILVVNQGVGDASESVSIVGSQAADAGRGSGRGTSVRCLGGGALLSGCL